MKLRLSRVPATAALLAAITTVFIFEWYVGALGSNEILWRLGAITPTMLQDGQWWRIFAAMFLHANLPHVLANSWTLYQLGTLYEAMFGTKRFVITYFVTGACASIASSLGRSGGISVGASGAVLGILGALIVSIRRSPLYRNEPWTKGLVAQLVFWALLNLAIGFGVEQIDNIAHIAGLVTGLLLGLVPHRVPPPPPNRDVIDVYAEPAAGPGDRIDVR
jgi:rhomboid protease GluP